MRPAISLLFALFLALEATATTVVLERAGVPVAGGEVCRFAADDRENPFKRWLGSGELTCVAAGPNVVIPTGLWNVFARVEGKLVSAPRLVDGSRAPSHLTFAVREAAAITTTFPSDRRGVFYVPRLAYAVPAEGRTTVPADEEMWLFIVGTKKVHEQAEVLSLLSIPAAATGTVRPLEPRPGSNSNVIGWMYVPAAERAIVRKLTTPPKITVTTENKTVIDGDPAPAPSLLHGAFVRVRGAAAGGVGLNVGGEGWMPAGQGAKVSDAVTVVRSALTTRPAGSLIVNWSRAKDLLGLNSSIDACEKPRPRAKLEIILSRCMTPQPDQPHQPSTCRPVSRTEADGLQPHGSFAVNELPPGFYQAEMKFGYLPPVFGTGTVIAHQQRALYVRADYEQLFGTVTKAKKPLGEPFTLAFDGSNGAGSKSWPGTAFRFRPSPTGPDGQRKTSEQLRREYEEFALAREAAYQAVVKTLPRTDTQIEVTACDGDPHVIVLSDASPKPGERFDIRIPDNEVTLRVTDTFTREPLRGAPVRYTVLSKSEPHVPVVNGLLRTGTEEGKEGLATLLSVPERKTTFSVSYPGYEKRTLGPFTILEGERRTIDVQLVPLRGGESRIASDKEFLNGAVYWYSPDGLQTEVAELFPDGAFVYTGTHTASETMVVISESHPLWVSRSQRLDGRRGVQLTFPALASRDFEVVIPEAPRNQAHAVGLMIGGLLVPAEAFTIHQSLRRLPDNARGSSPLRVAAIGESGPIDVLLGPPVDSVPTRWRGMNLFTLPSYADSPKLRLEPESDGVVFDEP